MASGRIRVEFDSTSPSTPSAGQSLIYPKGPDGQWCTRRPDGVERQIELPSGANGEQTIKWDETLQQWVLGYPKLAYTRQTQWLEDWGANSSAGSLNWDADTANSGAISSTSTVGVGTNRPGVIQYQIVLGSGSRAGNDRNVADVQLGGGVTNIASNVYFSLNALDPTENAIYETGLSDIGSDFTGGAGFPNFGVFFRVDSGGSGNFEAVCCDSAVATVVDTLINPSVERWYRLEFDVNETATQVDFRIFDDTPSLLWSGSITSNIPSGSGNFVQPFNQLRHNGSAGLTTIQVLQDFFFYRKQFTLER